MPIIVAPTNPSCSTSTSTSSSSDSFTCDASLMVENATLKKKVNELTHTLAKAYGGENCLLMCLVAKELLSTKRDWAIPPRKARRPLLLTRLVLWRIMVGFTIVASKLVIKSMCARTRTLMYHPLSLILVICSSKVLMGCMLSLLVHQLWAQRRELFRCKKLSY